MMHAQKANWAAYAPGDMPDNVKSITINSPTQVTFTFTKSYNPLWLTYNQFSQITPLPLAWDITAGRRQGGVGRVLGRSLRHGRRGVHGRLHLPVQAGRIRPGEPVRPPTTRSRPTPPTRCGRSWTGRGI